MLKTRLTALLGIKYPIVAGGMMALSRSQFVAAISEAGALGIIAALTFDSAELLQEEVRETRKLTSRPFGVNIALLPTARPLKIEDYFRVAIEERVAAVETSGRSPEPYIAELKRAGVKVMHKVGALRHGLTAERIGCDAVISLGYEGAGHPLMDDVTALVLTPVMAGALQVPVIAAGGFADGRGLAAALCLGAEGILMGTRFIATKECPAHPAVKEALVKARETDTVLIQRSIQNQARVLRNKISEKVLEMEARGAALEELLPEISGQRGRTVWAEGDINAGTVGCGQAVGLIQDVPSVKELLDRIVAEAEDTLKRLASR